MSIVEASTRKISQAWHVAKSERVLVAVAAPTQRPAPLAETSLHPVSRPAVKTKRALVNASMLYGPAHGSFFTRCKNIAPSVSRALPSSLPLFGCRSCKLHFSNTIVRLALTDSGDVLLLFKGKPFSYELSQRVSFNDSN